MDNSTAQPKKLSTWFFNPFTYVAGEQALVIGLGVILASSYIASLSNTHFDGVLDMHTGATGPMVGVPARGSD